MKTAEEGGPRGYDAGKKIKWRKRHIVTDTLGNMLEGVDHGASVRDRDGAPGMVDRTCETYPTLLKLFADGGYAGQKLQTAIAPIDRLPIDITKRCDTGKLVILPAAGSLNAPLLGSTGADASPRTGRHPSRRPRPGWSSHPSGE